MLLKRWLTSLVAIPILILIISFSSGMFFAAFIATVCLLSGLEYFYIIYSGQIRQIFTPITVIALLSGAGAVFAAEMRPDTMILILFSGVIGVAVCTLFAFSREKEVLSRAEKAFQFFVYIPLSLSTIVFLRSRPEGSLWVYFLLFIIFAGDVGAFYVGTYFGRHKLAPGISPKKTMEGAAGGLLVNLVVGLLFKMFFLSDLPFGMTAGFILIAGVAGQVGDLFESELKRVADIKDSGAILPGHGGMLDRIDALLFAAPVTYFFHLLTLS